MLWKVPAEHTVASKPFDAELQIYHVQLATNRKVALSLLFDLELFQQADAAGTDVRRLKTCFVDSFEFEHVDHTAEHQNLLDVPLREFINFVPQDKMIYYTGSET